MSETPLAPVRVGAVRAAKPRAVRTRTAKVLAPAIAALAVSGMALVAVAQQAAPVQEASSVPSVDEIAQAQAQGYTAALVAGEGDAASIVVSDRSGDTGSVTVATPEPTPEPSESTSSGSSDDSNSSGKGSSDSGSSGGNSGGSSSNPSPAEMPAYDPGSYKDIAASMLPSYGWGGEQMVCLDNLWTKESHWNPNAVNSSSGAYGIPQAMPLHFSGGWGDYKTNPTTQITWGLNYIAGSRHGTPCGAWSHSQAYNWY